MIAETTPNIKVPDTYSIVLSKDAQDYLNGFTERAQLKWTWGKSSEVKECYTWCEKHLGIKYKDWFMMGDVIHFKDTKKATFFRLTWGDIIA